MTFVDQALTPDPLAGVLDRPAPPVSPEAAEAIAQRCFGVSGRARALAGERDRNFQLVGAGGGITEGAAWMLKVIHPDEDPGVSDLQTEALREVARVDPGVPVPRVVEPLPGAIERVEVAPGVSCAVRLTTWIEGVPLSESASVGADIAAQLGSVLGRIDRALEGLRHPAEEHVLLWDTARVLTDDERYAVLVGPQADLAEALAPVRERLLAGLPDLPRQLIHNDLNPHNVIVRGGRVAGVIDVGDLVRGPRVQDPAVAAAYLIDPAQPLVGPAALLAAYREVVALSAAEVEAFLDLVLARLGLAMAISRRRAERHPGNAAYILRNHERARAGLEALTRLGLHERGWRA